MKPNKEQELNDRIIDLAKRQRLGGWNEFVEELKVPSELVPGLITMRPELIRLTSVRPLTASEGQALYTLIGALIETNMALREHAQGVATMVENWTGSIYGMVKLAGRIERFAEFRHADAADPSDDDE